MKKSVLIPYERYVMYQNMNKTDEPSTEPAESDTKQIDEKLSADIILSYLPKRNQAKARSLLKVINDSPVLDWNVKGELLVNNEPVIFSHISDLLHDALNNTKNEPLGSKEFYSNLQHIPVSLIGNPKRRMLIGGRTLPPPGLPNKPPKALNSWKSLWKPL